jgi:XrtJ-associated TM-motif-TM protein
MKKTLLVMFSLTVLLKAASLHAQMGCDDSPENPTVVLALVGSAGALVASARSRMKARRRPVGGGKSSFLR